MGMAASQARFLQLTARKTNIEYMGQQINQERLALANESAGLFERQLTMVPPTPPSSLDDSYYTQGYHFEDSDGIQKKISWLDADDMAAAITAGTIITGATTFSVNTINTNGGGSVEGTVDSGISNTVLFVTGDNYINDEDSDVSSAGAFDGIMIDNELETLANAMDLAPQDDTSHVVLRYIEITHDAYQPDGTSTTVTERTPAILEFDNLERLINVTPLSARTTFTGDFTAAASFANIDGNVDSISGQIGAGEDLTYSPVFDQAAFDDDMNKYEYEKATYDYEIERINLETEKIQKQDKSLELKLKQLDTEHNAIQTEIDAVQKVIQKNVESSFKTFS